MAPDLSRGSATSGSGSSGRSHAEVGTRKSGAQPGASPAFSALGARRRLGAPPRPALPPPDADPPPTEPTTPGEQLRSAGLAVGDRATSQEANASLANQGRVQGTSQQRSVHARETVNFCFSKGPGAMAPTLPRSSGSSRPPAPPATPFSCHRSRGSPLGRPCGIHGLGSSETSNRPGGKCQGRRRLASLAPDSLQKNFNAKLAR